MLHVKIRKSSLRKNIVAVACSKYETKLRKLMHKISILRVLQALCVNQLLTHTLALCVNQFLMHYNDVQLRNHWLQLIFIILMHNTPKTGDKNHRYC